MGLRCVLFAGAGIVALANSARADVPAYLPRTTYGEVGILEMPSAHMAPDGELAFTLGDLNGTERYNASFQLLPWLEGSFRYTHIIKLYNNSYYDRSFGLKIRLFEEGPYMPDVSLGFRDILGTGIYSGEYLAGSKHFGDFDVTLGLGWGRFAESNALPNPFAQIFPSFKERAPHSPFAGTVNFGQFFHGPKMGVFGGVVWRSPIKNLDVLVEYSPDRYSLEHSFGVVKVRIPVNVGLSYHPMDGMTFSAGWVFGTAYAATMTFAVDPTTPLSSVRLGPEIPSPDIRSPQQQVASLALLLSGKPIGGTSPGPWVDLSPPEDRQKLALVSALTAEGAGVRNVETAGKTLMIEASLTGSASTRCDSYARIAANFSVPLSSVAVSDVSRPQGLVTFCDIRGGQAAQALQAIADVRPQEPPPAAKPIAAVYASIVSMVAAQSLTADAVSINGASAWLYFTNTRYNSEDEAVGRIARILMAEAPTTVEVFHLVSVKNGMPMREFEISRSALERAAATYGTSFELGDAIAINPAPWDNPILDKADEATYPRLKWSIGPGIRQGLFDPDRPIEFQIFASVDASLDVWPGVTLETRLEANLYNDFSFKRQSDSELPHVRSDTLHYLQDGANGIARLDAIYHGRLAPDVYFEAKAGYLESMFAGAGGQVLWRPENERVSFGADLYQVWQRNFDRLFGVQDYHVLTGHVSAYYESPWYGINFAVHAGRYLAGDYGATIEVTRRFSTGVEIGAFATFTNVPFAKFGEGSFDKGIIVHIPFEWGLPSYTQSSYSLLLRSLTRDGGQRLEADDSLFTETRPTSSGAIMSDLDDITAP
jgi:hypothetical protein